MGFTLSEHAIAPWGLGPIEQLTLLQQEVYADHVEGAVDHKSRADRRAFACATAERISTSARSD